MDNYFYSLLPEEEISQLSYIPTVPEFVTWIGLKWGDKPAVSKILLSFQMAKM